MPPKRKASVQIPSTSGLSSKAETTAPESDVKKRKVATKQVEETRRKRSNPRTPTPPTAPSCSFLPDDIPLGNIDVSRAYNVFSAQNFITQVEMIVCPVCNVEFPIDVDKKRKMICQHMIDNHQSIFREVNHVPCEICHAPISAKNPLLHYRNEHRMPPPNPKKSNPIVDFTSRAAVYQHLVYPNIKLSDLKSVKVPTVRYSPPQSKSTRKKTKKA